MTRIKICGITRARDALAAAAAGADAIGFVLEGGSREVRAAEIRAIVGDLPPFIRTVGVFRHAGLASARALAASAGIEVIQLHGEEPEPADGEDQRSVIQRLHVAVGDTTAILCDRIARVRGAMVLLDPGAGSGLAFPWTLARGLGRPVIVAGGLHAGNVGRAIREARPYAVDVSSGVEDASGVKSVDRMRAFVDAVRREDLRDRA